MVIVHYIDNFKVEVILMNMTLGRKILHVEVISHQYNFSNFVKEKVV